MNILILRVMFGLGFLWAWQEAVVASETVGLYSGAFPYVGMPMVALLFLAVANGIVWTPFIGARLVSPLTGSYIRTSYSKRKNRLVRMIHRMEKKGWRRRVVWASWLAGHIRPNEPEVFYLGLQNAAPGSGMQRYFAEKVYQFLNGRRCLEAFLILRSLGYEPAPHREQSINRIVLAHVSRKSLKPKTMPVPAITQAPFMAPNPAIRLPGQFHKVAGETSSLPTYLDLN